MKGKVNLNEQVRVKLTDEGRRLHRRHHEDFLDTIPTMAARASHTYTPPTLDAEGYALFRLWRFMEVFGPYTHMGGRLMFEDNCVEFTGEG